MYLVRRRLAWVSPFEVQKPGDEGGVGFISLHETPTSADGIEKYLSSGMIRGVGPAYAKKLVRAFGEKLFDVIEATPDRLREVDGIGPVRAAHDLVLPHAGEWVTAEPLATGVRGPPRRPPRHHPHEGRAEHPICRLCVGVAWSTHHHRDGTGRAWSRIRAGLEGVVSAGKLLARHLIGTLRRKPPPAMACRKTMPPA
jgi:Helix-hairpin-helix domain